MALFQLPKSQEGSGGPRAPRFRLWHEGHPARTFGTGIVSSLILGVRLERFFFRVMLSMTPVMLSMTPVMLSMTGA